MPLNRDTAPLQVEVAIQTAAVLALADRAYDRAPGPYPGFTGALPRIRGELTGVWAQLTPEAVRDTMLLAAMAAVRRGARVPENVNARALLGLAAGKASPAGLMAVQAFASSLAFDRDADDETLTALAVLLTLARC